MPTKPSHGKSLAEVNPELAKEWHPTKNGELTSCDVTAGSGKKVWWKCEKGDDHEWIASISNRVRGTGCSVCSNKLVVPSNCLATTHPELAKEWHSTLNKDKTPFDVIAGTNKKFWWKCDKGDDHEWMAVSSSRVNGNGCPICSGKLTVKSTSMASTHPELAKEWHPIKNGNLTPFDVASGSNKKVWWKCDKGDDHEWNSVIYSRTQGTSCPICSNNMVVRSNCMATTHPELAKEWHPTKNVDVTPFDITAGSNKRYWWKCNKGDDHEWRTTAAARKSGNGCGICSGQVIVKSNSLGVTHPELANEWHPTKNGYLTPYEVGYGSGKKVWWKCEKGDDHEWLSDVKNRVHGNSCPVCSNNLVVSSNSMATTHPELAKEWHPTKNGNLTPFDITAGSNKRYWWRCDKGDDHEWKTSANNRLKGTNCPICDGKLVVPSTCMATTRPELAKEWHPTKNGKLTPFDVGPGSGKKVWWKCEKGDDHEWFASIEPRGKKDVGCPFCTLTPQSRQELTITFELLTIFKGINPKGFKKRIDSTLYSIDIYIPKINIGIEFDGSYWHKDNQVKDKQKTLNIEETGLNLIRVRQKPLERLFEDDVMAEKKFDGKQITNDILKQIVKDNGKYAYSLDKVTLNNIEKYLTLEGLQNEKGLDKYIDQILTEKAERKQKKS